MNDNYQAPPSILLGFKFTKLEDGRNILLEDVKFINPYTAKSFFAPAGFVTDFVSTKILKFSARCDIPSIFHDYDYWAQSKTRKDADIDYKNNLLAFGVSSLLVNTQYFTLRAFGWAAWGRNKRNKARNGDKGKIINIPPSTKHPFF